MIQLAVSILLSLSIMACGTNNSETIDQDHIVKNIEAKEMSQLISDNADAIVIDVRTEEELSGGMVPNAINIDFYSDDFKSKLSELDSDKPVFVYCAAGGRSGKAMKMMKEMNFKEVYNLKGGFPTWQNAGLEVSK